MSVWRVKMSEETLNKLWPYLRNPGGRRSVARRREIDRLTRKFLAILPDPSDDQWMRFAYTLKTFGLYSHTTSSRDILVRLEQMQMK